MGKAHFFQDAPHPTFLLLTLLHTRPLFFWHKARCRIVGFTLSSINTLIIANQPTEPAQSMVCFPEFPQNVYLFFLFRLPFLGNIKSLFCLFFLRT